MKIFQLPIGLRPVIQKLVPFGPFSIVGIVKRTEKDIANIELFIRASYEGVSGRTFAAVALAETDPMKSQELLAEARQLALRTATLISDYAETGYMTIKKMTLGSALAMLFKRKDADIFREHRSRARDVAMEFGFPIDVQMALGVQLPPLPPGTLR